MATTVADLTPAELRELIEAAVDEKLVEFFGDPDEGLELRPEVVERLKRQMKRVADGERGVPLAEAIRSLDR